MEGIEENDLFVGETIFNEDIEEENEFEGNYEGITWDFGETESTTIDNGFESIDAEFTASDGFLAGFLVAGGIIIAIIGIIGSILGILTLIASWKINKKANKPGWACLVPIYNTWVTFEIAGMPGWQCLLLVIPIVNIIFIIKWAINFSKAFGKSGAFAAGLIFLSPIFILILGFGKSEYVLAQNDTPIYTSEDNNQQPVEVPTQVDTTTVIETPATVQEAPATVQTVETSAPVQVAPTQVAPAPVQEAQAPTPVVSAPAQVVPAPTEITGESNNTQL